MSPDKKEISHWLVVQLAEALEIQPGEIDPRMPFASYGLSSRAAVTLTGDLEEWLGRRLQPTLAWEHPTIEALAEHLAGQTSAHENRAISEVGEVTQEPIALIGIGCRFPGANGPAAFWHMLKNGVDAIREVPPDRWDLESLYDTDPGAPGKMVTRFGGFLDGIDEFDPQFFGISPREAERMDPQQRILLEVAWEALEDAGVPPDSLAGSLTGVFVGISTMEYGQLQWSDPERIDAYVGTGNALSIAPNRLSYFLDLRGPSLAVDTACSSSLLAVHLACEGIWRGETPLAMAGGVSLMLSPVVSIAFTKAGLMAPDGRCKTFDARANGYVRGEGAGIVVLKPLSLALKDRDRIYAVIRGSAVAHDGRSNGLMAPNPESQKAVLREAYRQAGIKPGQVQFVEAHGTGTFLGDPIEANAMGDVLEEGRATGHQIAIGSVKTNIGHLEAAAGVAGLIKVALSLFHQSIPPSLHFERPNPHIPLTELGLRVQTDLAPWPDHTGKALAGVSSFGFGGTNVHAVLEQAPAPEISPIRAEPALVQPYRLPLSAQGPNALRALVRETVDFLQESDDSDLPGICYTAGVRRSHLGSRLACVANNRRELIEQLEAYLRREARRGVFSRDQILTDQPKLAFVFPGQGSQWLGMGRELVAAEPQFRKQIEVCDAAIKPRAGWSLLEVLGSEDQTGWVEEIDIVQPTLFAIQTALAALWRFWGVEPDAVVGHSMGEVAAAHVAGALSLDEAIQVICERSRLMKQTSGEGAMLATGLSLKEAGEILAGYEEHVAIAVSNSPESTVLSGDPPVLEELFEKLERQGVFCRFVQVDVAAHSPSMDAIREPLVQELYGIQPVPNSIPIYSTVAGQVVDGPSLTPTYWGGNLREPVQFSATIERMLADGFGTFLEISPHPILASAIQQCLKHYEAGGEVLASLRREEPERRALLGSLAALHTLGYPIDWRRHYPSGGCPVRLPPYPWQRQRYWLSQDGSVSTGIPFPQSREDRPESAGESIYQDWLYELKWQTQEHRPAVRQSPGQKGAWVIFLDGQGVGEALASQLEREGRDCLRVSWGKSFQATGGGFQVRLDEAGDFKRLAAKVFENMSAPLAGVVHLWGLDAASPEGMSIRELERGQALGARSTVRAIQAFSQSFAEGSSRLWLVTRGAQPVGDDLSRLSPAQAPLWGLGRTVAQEEPAIWGGLIDLDPAGSAEQAADQILGEILHTDGEDQVAFRMGQRHVARLDRQTRRLETTSSPRWRKDASYLITGGLGGLGIELARWLVAQGARRMILMGRTTLPPRLAWGQMESDNLLREKVQAVLELEAMGASVHLAAVDVADEEQLRGFLERYRLEGWPPIRGVFHLAGVAQGKSLQEIDQTELDAVLRPKIAGAWLLHRLFAEKGMLDYFVLFSSATALFSLPFHGSYAAANAFLDTLAHLRRAQGRPALSVNWGAWSKTGMADRFQKEHGRELTPRGAKPFRPEHALKILDFLLAQKATQACVLDMDWVEWRRFYPTAAQSRLLSHFLDRNANERLTIQPGGFAAPKSMVEQLLESSPEDQVYTLDAYLRTQIGQVLHTDATAIPGDRNLADLGLDSLMAMELIRRMESDLRIRVFTREVFERPSINALATYLPSEIERSRKLGAIAPSARRSSLPPEARISVSESLAAVTQEIIPQPLSKPIKRNPSAVFLLSAPRSGSTLLRVMLDGHSGLFSPPELHLLPFSTMQQRQQDLKYTYLDEGLHRALMNVSGIDPAESKTLVEEWIREDWTIQQVYGQLQTRAGGRLLVDKSPSYGASKETLLQAEALFEHPKYIHLVRHPYAVIESFTRMRLDRLLGAGDVDPHAFAEQIWTTINRNIHEFRMEVGGDRVHHVFYEDLVREPEKEMRRLCAFLGVPFEEQVLNPYEGDRMTDGVYSSSLSIGDPNFLHHHIIDPSLGEAWRAVTLPHLLTGATQRLAGQFGYELPFEKEHDFAHEAHPSLVPIQPEGAMNPFFLVHPGSGLVYFYYLLGQLLGPDLPFFALQDPSLRGDREPHSRIEDYAEEYIRAVRSIQPEGPYRIGGWSFGGHVAFEMAHQLRSCGQKVNLVLLLDSEAPLADRRINFHQRVSYWKNKVAEFAAFLRDVGPYTRDGIVLLLKGKKLDEAHPRAHMTRREYIRWMWADAIHKRLVRRAGMAELISQDASYRHMRIPTLRRALYVLGRHMQVVSRYRPIVYPGDLTLLRATEQVKRQFFSDLTLGWDQLVSGKVDVRHIPGNHATLFREPYVRDLARAIRGCIEQADRQSSPSDPC